MRTLSITILICLSLSGARVFAGDVLILQSLRVKPFNEALQGFRSVCKAKSKTMVLSDMEGVDIIRTVREERPRVILAIGADALQRVNKIRDIPIIHLMVLNPEQMTGGGNNFVGVDMNVPPEKYLDLIGKLNLPKLKIGILFNPAKTGTFVKRIKQTARSKGIEITAKEIHHPREVPEQLSGMKNSFNVFWMLPDSTVVTSETVEFLLLFTQRNRVPVVTFAGKYVDTGALVSLDVDGSDMGKEGGEMTNNILAGAQLSDLSDKKTRKTTIKINRNVAKKLGIDLNALEPQTISN